MNIKNKVKAGYLVMGLALIVILSRLLPHAPNFTGSLAAIVFSAVALRSWKAFAGIVLAYLFSDLIINNILYTHNDFQWLSPGVYWILIPFVVVFAANFFLFGKGFSPLGIFGSSLFSSILFFLTTNFGVWISSKITYTHDLNGLLLCYFNALPFFGYEMAGTLFYSSVIFSVYWLYFYEYRSYEFKR